MLRNLYAGQEATVRTGLGTTDWLQIGKEYIKAVYCHPAYYFFSFIFISWRLITLQDCSGFYHTLTWISHGFTCVPHPEPPSHLFPHPIPLGSSQCTSPKHLSHASNLDWRSVSQLIMYMLWSCSLRSSHSCLLP